MKVLPYAVREVWSRFKGASLTADAPPVHAYALASLAKWAEQEAGSPGGPPRGLREALAASVSGAALVDAAIEKLAEQGRYTPEEKEFLLDLNAEAALRDLRQLLKTSSAFGDALRSPTLRGAVAGGVVGGGLGAWKDDDNRLRGALSYGVPGAAIGAVAGHGYGTWAKARQLAGEEQARKVVDDMHAVDDFNVRRIQGQDWAKAQDAAHAIQAGAPAAEKAKAQADAARWHKNLFEAADMFTRHSDKTKQEYAKHLKQQMHAYKDSIIEHATDNPQSVHRVLVHAAGVDGGQKTLNEILNHARMLHKNGN
jgi:hypothetical protein